MARLALHNGLGWCEWGQLFGPDSHLPVLAALRWDKARGSFPVRLAVLGRRSQWCSLSRTPLQPLEDVFQAYRRRWAVH